MFKERTQEYFFFIEPFVILVVGTYGNINYIFFDYDVLNHTAVDCQNLSRNSIFLIFYACFEKSNSDTQQNLQYF
jgi:hypothetical protein